MNRDPGNDDERKTTSYDEKSVHDRIMRRTESIGGAGSTRERNIPHDRVPGERVKATGFGPGTPNIKDIRTPANGMSNIKDAHPSTSGTPNIKDIRTPANGTPSTRDARSSSTSREGTVNPQERGRNTVQGREKGDQPRGKGQDNQTHTEAKPKPTASETAAKKAPAEKPRTGGM